MAKQDMIESATERYLRQQGYICVQTYYPWGRTPAYRNQQGDYRFINQGRVLDVSAMYQALCDTWRPGSGSAEYEYCANGSLRRDFVAMGMQI